MRPEKVLTTIELVLWSNTALVFESPYHTIFRYAELMQAPLSLEMFIPCKDGEPMEEPKKCYCDINGGSSLCERLCEFSEYRQTQERVLFEGYKWNDRSEAAQRWVNGKLHSQYLMDGNNDTIVKSDKCYLKLPSSIEDLARQIDLIGNDNFWEKVGL